MKGYGFKQADQLTARFLNDVNDPQAGGALVSLPAGVASAQVVATQTGDAIIMDDATAAALSDTTVGTLFGGIYMYVGTLSSAVASPQRGAAAFYRAADLPSAVTALYQVTSDAQPATTNPSMFAGVFINAITKGNFGWIQIGGVASCLFDTGVTPTAGNYCATRGAAGVAATVASTFDSNPAVATPASAAIANSQIICSVGVIVQTGAAASIQAVQITRSPYVRT